jgi:hypothetical protein
METKVKRLSHHKKEGNSEARTLGHGCGDRRKPHNNERYRDAKRESLGEKAVI